MYFVMFDVVTMFAQAIMFHVVATMFVHTVMFDVVTMFAHTIMFDVVVTMFAHTILFHVVVTMCAHTIHLGCLNFANFSQSCCFSQDFYL